MASLPLFKKWELRPDPRLQSRHSRAEKRKISGACPEIFQIRLDSGSAEPELCEARKGPKPVGFGPFIMSGGHWIVYRVRTVAIWARVAVSWGRMVLSG